MDFVCLNPGHTNSSCLFLQKTNCCVPLSQSSEAKNTAGSLGLSEIKSTFPLGMSVATTVATNILIQLHLSDSNMNCLKTNKSQAHRPHSSLNKQVGLVLWHHMTQKPLNSHYSSLCGRTMWCFLIDAKTQDRLRAIWLIYDDTWR